METLQVKTGIVMQSNVAGKKGLQSSKYLTGAQLAIILALQQGQGVVLPFLPDVTSKAQRHNVAHRIAMQGFGRIGDNRTELPEYNVGIVAGEGIGVVRALPQENTVVVETPEEKKAIAKAKRDAAKAAKEAAKG